MDTVEGWASYMTVSGSTWIAIMGLTERGFTGHQHVDRLDLIHMNGRTYDTKLGRFMQADIVVQSPFDTQSYNRYSYLMNNPLNGTDPSGYFSLRDLKEYAGVIIGGALLAWHPLGYGIWQSAVYGAIAGGSSAAVNGGNVLQGAAIGAFSAAAFAGLDGAGFGWGAAGDVGQHTLNIAASGVLGGTITVLQGGKFGHGFASAGFTAAAGGGIRAGIRTPGGRIVASAIAGGTVSEISGGKFANGAFTAAFQAAAGEVSDQAVAARRGNGKGVVGARADVENPGAVFETREKAGYDVTNKINSLSIEENLEYQWVYYQDTGTDRFGYTDPYAVGLSGGAHVSLPISVNGSRLLNASVFGMGHTHGNYSDAAGQVVSKSKDIFNSDRFSRGRGSDMWFMSKGGANGEWNYFTLGTPSGRLWQWTPEYGQQPLTGH
ncbi:MAG: DUF4329 domain-containing protein [Gammaproteobacteria bacterium]|nr:DUF4329 domain-containing protein [Gammaproteobacteria bacterium]